MDNVKNRMYNYETTPPEGVWQAIANELDRDEARVIPLRKKKNYTFYYIAAASVVVILLSVFFFNNHSSNSAKDGFVISPNRTQNDSVKKSNNNVIITVPEEEKTITRNDNSIANSRKEITIIKSKKGEPNSDNNKVTKKTNDTADNKIIASNSVPQYITIEGPQGQPVKVSSKMSLMIDSSNDKVPPKPIWNKKINEWREIMKGNTLAPTPGNFLDIIELTKTVKDHK